MNDEIEIMRCAAINSILERRDTIIVASVACIYGASNPEQYKDMFEVVNPQAINPEQGGSTNANLTGVDKAFYALNPDLRK